MSTYLIGDIHGCYDELKIILSKINFNIKLDTIWFTGDLVSRGPNSLKVLRLLYKLNRHVRIVLGNHDLYLLSVYLGINKNNSDHNITQILEASDSDILINWLRHQPLLQIDKEKKLIMVHAGIAPQWDINTTIQYAKALESILINNNHFLLNKILRNNTNNYSWDIKFNSLKKLQFSINVFTRMRYCSSSGQLDMTYKDSPEEISTKKLIPWFNLLNPIFKNYNIVFGHWSSLIKKNVPVGMYCLDTGCCWGNKLTALNWEKKQITYQVSKKNYVYKK